MTSEASPNEPKPSETSSETTEKMNGTAPGGGSCPFSGAALCSTFSSSCWDVEQLKKSFQLAKDVVANPAGVWTSVKAETWSVKDIYQKLLIPVALIPAIAGFIGHTILGPGHFFSGLWSMIANYGIQLAVVYLMAYFILKLAPQFGGSTTIENAMKLVVVSMLPGLFACAVMVLPLIILVVIPLLAGLAGMYAMYQGVPEMTGISADKRLPFFATIFVSAMLASLVFESILKGF